MTSPNPKGARLYSFKVELIISLPRKGRQVLRQALSERLEGFCREQNILWQEMQGQGGLSVWLEGDYGRVFETIDFMSRSFPDYPMRLGKILHVSVRSLN